MVTSAEVHEVNLNEETDEHVDDCEAAATWHIGRAIGLKCNEYESSTTIDKVLEKIKRAHMITLEMQSETQVLNIFIMNFLHLNVRGLCSCNKDSHVRDFITKFKPQVLGLTGTKLKEADISRTTLLWGRSLVKLLSSDATDNNSGGVISLWNPDTFECLSFIQGERWILVKRLLVMNDKNVL